MARKRSIPIGQGCKCVTLLAGIHERKEFHLCAKHMYLYYLRCFACGEPFHSEAPHTKTCSDKCRKRLSRMRHETLFQTVMKFAEG